MSAAVFAGLVARCYSHGPGILVQQRVTAGKHAWPHKFRRAYRIYRDEITFVAVGQIFASSPVRIAYALLSAPVLFRNIIIYGADGGRGRA